MHSDAPTGPSNEATIASVSPFGCLRRGVSRRCRNCFTHRVAEGTSERIFHLPASRKRMAFVTCRMVDHQGSLVPSFDSHRPVVKFDDSSLHPLEPHSQPIDWLHVGIKPMGICTQAQVLPPIQRLLGRSRMLPVDGVRTHQNFAAVGLAADSWNNVLAFP